MPDAAPHQRVLVLGALLISAGRDSDGCRCREEVVFSSAGDVVFTDSGTLPTFGYTNEETVEDSPDMHRVPMENSPTLLEVSSNYPQITQGVTTKSPTDLFG